MINNPLWFMKLQESEQMTLGGILLYPERLSRVESVLNLKDFRYEKHRLIFSAMLEMDKQNLLIDVVTLFEFLEGRGQLDRVGRASYLTYLCQIAWRCQQ